MVSTVSMIPSIMTVFATSFFPPFYAFIIHFIFTQVNIILLFFAFIYNFFYLSCFKRKSTHLSERLNVIV
jgi:hypothetical protein